MTAFYGTPEGEELRREIKTKAIPEVQPVDDAALLTGDTCPDRDWHRTATRRFNPSNQYSSMDGILDDPPPPPPFTPDREAASRLRDWSQE